MKLFPSIFCLPSVGWNYNWERQHELIYRLSDYSEKVVIQNPYGMINYNAVQLIQKVRQNLNTTEPTQKQNPRKENMIFEHNKFIPYHYCPPIDNLNSYIVEKQSAVHLESSLIYAGYINGFTLNLFEKGKIKWLDLFQRRQNSIYLSKKAKDKEKQAVKIADLVVVDSVSTLEDYASIRKDILYLPQGVDTKRFYRLENKTQHTKLKDNYRAVVGYAGADHVLDYPIILSLINAFPEVLFFFIGEFRIENKQKISRFKNVFFTGRLGYYELLEAYNLIDIGLIPYVLNEHTSGVFPTKYYEYLACGSKVLTSALPDLISKESGYVQVYRNNEDALQKLETLLHSEAEVEKALFEASQNTWEIRFNTVLEKLKLFI